MDTLVSNFQSSPEYSSPATRHDRPDQSLLELLDHIEKGRASELHQALTVEDPAAIVNRIIPPMVNFPALSRYHDLSGKPLLYWAATTSSVEVVETLLLAGAEIDQPAETFLHHTPLMAAIARSDTPIVHLLLARGASVSPRTTDGDQALHIACHCARDPDIVENLLARISAEDPVFHEKDDSCRALELALSRRKQEYGGHTHIVTTRIVCVLLAAIEHPARLTQNFLEPWQQRGDWAGHITEDEQESLLLLVKDGLNLEMRFTNIEQHDETTLAHALLFHCPRGGMARFLARRLEPGPVNNMTALLFTLAAGCHVHMLSEAESAEAISILLKRGVNPEERDENGHTPLKLWTNSLKSCVGRSSIRDKFSVLASLLGHNGANPSRENLGSCPILDVLKQSWASDFKDVTLEILEMLLSHYPLDMSGASLWRRVLADFLAPPDKFQSFHWHNLLFNQQMARNGPFLGGPKNLLCQALHIVSTKKFLAAQFRKDKMSRSYDEISQALKQLTSYSVPMIDIPAGFVVDAISLIRPSEPPVTDLTESAPAPTSVPSSSQLKDHNTARSMSPNTQGYWWSPPHPPPPWRASRDDNMNVFPPSASSKPAAFHYSPWASAAWNTAPGWSPGRLTPNQAAYFGTPYWHKYLNSPYYRDTSASTTKDHAVFTSQLHAYSQSVQSTPAVTLPEIDSLVEDERSAYWNTILVV